jgi:PAS domain S-box-containing protein
MTGRQPQTDVRERNGHTEAGARLFADQLPEHLLESVPDAVVAVARDGSVVLVNREAERIFGYGREELLGELLEKPFSRRDLLGEVRTLLDEREEA